MVEVARGLLEEKEEPGEIEKGRMSFEMSSAEELGFIENETIDLVVACKLARLLAISRNGTDGLLSKSLVTAAHWFDPPKVYSEISRILKPSGSFYFFVCPSTHPAFPFSLALMITLHASQVGLLPSLVTISPSSRKDPSRTKRTNVARLLV